MHPRTAPQPEDTPPKPPKPLTPGQLRVCQAYFAAGCRTGRAATNLGCSRQYVFQCRNSQAGRALLEDMKAATIDVLVHVRAAQIIAPILGLKGP